METTQMLKGKRVSSLWGQRAFQHEDTGYGLIPFYCPAWLTQQLCVTEPAGIRSLPGSGYLLWLGLSGQGPQSEGEEESTYTYILKNIINYKDIRWNHKECANNLKGIRKREAKE